MKSKCPISLLIFASSALLLCNTLAAPCELADAYRYAEERFLDNGDNSDVGKRQFRAEWIRKLLLFTAKKDRSHPCYTKILKALVPLLSSDGDYEKASEMNALLVDALADDPSKLYWSLNLAELHFILFRIKPSKEMGGQAERSVEKANALLHANCRVQDVAHRLPSFLFEQMDFYESQSRFQSALDAALNALKLNSCGEINLEASPWKREVFLFRASKLAALAGQNELAVALFSEALDLGLVNQNVDALEGAARAIDSERAATYQALIGQAIKQTTGIQRLWLLQQLSKAHADNREYVAAASMCRRILSILDEDPAGIDAELHNFFRQDAEILLDASLSRLNRIQKQMQNLEK